jgi:hypothetical protein
MYSKSLLANTEKKKVVSSKMKLCIKSPAVQNVAFWTFSQITTATLTANLWDLNVPGRGYCSIE